MWGVLFTTALVYCLYVALGGGIFMLIEHQVEELGSKEDVTDNETITFAEMRFLLLNNFTNDTIDSAISSWCKDCKQEIFGNQSYTLPEVSWTYHNAFFFAFHLCSTIGYGDISPQTGYGQILAVFYALIGIPLHILFFKLLGESFAQGYQETVWLVKGEEESEMKKMVGDLIFFIPWTIVIFVIPSVVVMYTEDWSFIEGVYYCFITLSTVGLGDYVAGGGISHGVYFVLYKLIILWWMIYGLAFTSMIVDYLTHIYQMQLLFAFKCDWKECAMRIERIYVDVEKLDVHFRLLRSEGVKHKYSMWTVRKGFRQAVGFQKNHVANLALLAERVQGELIDLLQVYESDAHADSKKTPKDAFPAKTPKDAFPVKTPKDAFPVKDRSDDDEEANK